MRDSWHWVSGSWEFGEETLDRAVGDGYGFLTFGGCLCDRSVGF